MTPAYIKRQSKKKKNPIKHVTVRKQLKVLFFTGHNDHFVTVHGENVSTIS